MKCKYNLTHALDSGRAKKESNMKWQIEQYSTGRVMSEVFYDTERAEALIEMIAHVTGIAVDDLDAVWLAA